MALLQETIHAALHLDQYLAVLIASYGPWVYGLLFIIIFSETGLIITPFLPGDSLLFAAGTLTANPMNGLNIHWLFLLLLTASLLGNGCNYLVGRLIGPRIFSSPTSALFNQAYLLKAHAFYEKHGAKTLILARFIPIIRTFAPFIAGIGYMSHKQFFIYNLIGGLLWIGSVLYISYLFGNIPMVQEHFSILVIALIVLSFFPLLIGFTKKWVKKGNLT